MEFKHLKSLIERTYHISVDLSSESLLVEELGLDSLDLYTIIMQVEEMYSVEFPQDTLDRIASVSDFMNAIKEAMKL